jgi:hypothetical protein
MRCVDDKNALLVDASRLNPILAHYLDFAEEFIEFKQSTNKLYD